MMFLEMVTKVGKCAEAVKTCFDSLKTARLPRHPCSINVVIVPPLTTARPLSPAGSGLVLWPTSSISLTRHHLRKISQ
jgi:hypothetical protein